MWARLRIGLLGFALLAAAPLLGGCGGGSNSAARKLHAVLTSECGSGGSAEDALRGLEAGVAATEREFESAGGEGNKVQILRALEEDVAAIQHELSPRNDCTKNALREREGKGPLGPDSSLPYRPSGVAIARWVGPEKFELGGEERSASPCGQIGEHGVASVYITPHWSNCLRVPPGDRLTVVYPAPGTPDFAGVPVQVTIGGYEVWLAPGQKGVIPARIGSYLGEGSHQLGAAGAAFGSLIIVEPEASGR